MTAKEVIEKFFIDRNNLNFRAFSNKYWFEIHICEICSHRDGSKYDSQDIIVFNRIDAKDDKLLLLNNHNKVIKELSSENTEWLHNIYLCDKNLKILISDFNFVELKSLKTRGD